MRIVTYCPSYFVGVTSVFKNGEKLKLWTHLTDLKDLEDSDYLILGAIDKSYTDELFKRANAVLLTSTIGQMELMNEFIPFLIKLSKYKHLNIFCGHKDSCDALTLWMNRRVVYFPYPIEYKATNRDYVKNRSSSIGMFLPDSSRKNIINQVSAFFLLYLKINIIKLHTNLKLCGMNIITHGWLDRDKYLDLTRSFDFMFHVTFTESLSYGVVDSINNGVIPIVSKQVADYFKLPEKIIVNNSDSSVEIYEKTLNLLSMSSEELNSLLYECRFRLNVTAGIHNAQLCSLTESLSLV